MPPKGGYNKLTSYPPEYRDKVDRERKARVACVTRLAHLKRLKDTTTDEAKLQKLNEEIIEKNSDLRKHDENLAGIDSAATLSAVQLAEASGVSVDNALDQAEQGIKLARLARSTQKAAHNQIASMHGASHPPAFDDGPASNDGHADAMPAEAMPTDAQPLASSHPPAFHDGQASNDGHADAMPTDAIAELIAAASAETKRFEQGQHFGHCT